MLLVGRPHPGGNSSTDLSPNGVSAGDSGFFADDIWRSGKKVGRNIGGCVSILPTGPMNLLCVSTLVLPEGQLMLQGVPTPPNITYAVTGGTGAYKSSRGELAFRYDEKREDGTYRARLKLSR